MEPKKRYTDKDFVLDIERIKETIDGYEQGTMDLDNTLDCLWGIVEKAELSRIEYLWNGLYTLKDCMAIKRREKP